jgi:hypothetical protein
MQHQHFKATATTKISHHVPRKLMRLGLACAHPGVMQIEIGGNQRQGSQAAKQKVTEICSVSLHR